MSRRWGCAGTPPSTGCAPRPTPCPRRHAQLGRAGGPAGLADRAHRGGTRPGDRLLHRLRHPRHGPGPAGARPAHHARRQRPLGRHRPPLLAGGGCRRAHRLPLRPALGQPRRAPGRRAPGFDLAYIDADKKGLRRLLRARASISFAQAASSPSTMCSGMVPSPTRRTTTARPRPCAPSTPRSTPTGASPPSSCPSATA